MAYETVVCGQKSYMDVEGTPDTSMQPVSQLSNGYRENLNIHAWAWDSNRVVNSSRHTIFLTNDNREVKFHPSYSTGTSAVRGDTQFVPDHDYYWEIKVLTPLYGTDVMIGVGTAQVDLSKQEFTFCSMLGLDQESWGYSYSGTLQHNGKWQSYGPGFNKHSTVGVHLDMWNGTLSFFLNGKPLGVAFTSLKNQILYPMVSSTAAHSGIRLIYSYTCMSSLQQLCLRSLSSQDHMMKLVSSVPGLRGHVSKTFLNYEMVKTEEETQQDMNSKLKGFVIKDCGKEYVGKTEICRRKKRKYTGEVQEVHSSSTHVGCMQCGARFLSSESFGKPNIPSPTMLLRLQNSLCLVCADIV